MNKGSKILIGLLLIAVGVVVGKFFFQSDLGNLLPPVRYTNESAGTGNGSGADVASRVTGELIEVKDGESIQEAVTKANPGDLIRVYPGIYNETVYIDKDDISLQGVIENGEWPTLDGQKQMNDAVLYSGNGFLIENFKIIKYKGNAIMGQAGNNYVIRNNWVIDTGVYGIFPQYGKNGLVAGNVLSEIEDAAIYVGMCDNIDVINNEVFDNVAGIEIENSRHALVENNYAHDNTGGILVFVTPGLPIKTCYDVIVRNNFIVNNNHKNFGAPGSLVAGIPKGTGMLIMAADDVVVENNIITGNDNSGITITDMAFAGIQLSKDPESEPNPDRVVLLDNFMSNNGNNPIDDVKALMMTQLSEIGPDIIAVGGGSGSVRNKDRYRSFGLGSFSQAQIADTRSVKTFLLDKPVEPRVIKPAERSKLTYFAVCAGCHAYNMRMIGPPTQIIQALYKDNPQGIADYIKAPVHKRDDYPEMPPQDYIDEETRLEVAKFMLNIKK